MKSGETENYSIINTIEEFLKKYNINPKLKGYKYIVTILEYCFENNCFPGTTIYRVIAKKFSTKPANIQRCIDHVIYLIPHSSLNPKYRLTPTIFISALYQELKAQLCSFEDNIITNVLRKYNLIPNAKGYKFIFYILQYSLKNNFVPHRNIVNITYPLVAKEFSTTPKSVENAIKYAIQQTSNCTSYISLLQLYGNVTNTLFIATLYQELTIDNYTI